MTWYKKTLSVKLVMYFASFTNNLIYFFDDPIHVCVDHDEWLDLIHGTDNHKTTNYIIWP